MHATYKNALMWTLYGVLFLLIAVLQTGISVSLTPKNRARPNTTVCIACVSMLAGAEAGALYGLCCGTVWCFTGAAGGAMHIVLLTVCGAVIGYICDRYLVRQLLSAILMSLLALVFCQTLLFLFQCYLGTIHIGMITALPVQIGLSLLACPLLYLGAWAIRKVGAK